MRKRQKPADLNGISIRPAFLIAGGIALLALLVAKRKTIVTGVQMIGDAAKKLAFKAILPSAGRQYADIILQVAAEKGVSPFVLAALLQRETNFGLTNMPPGPAGKGDGGRGYGLMQIDVGGFKDWLDKNNWQDPLTNIRKGADVLKGKMSFLSQKPKTPTVTLDASAAAKVGAKAGTYADPRPLSGDKLVEASVAAYNTGEGRILQVLAVGKSVDTTTANGNYSTDVLATAKKLSSLFDSQAG
jgi:hypothetical protein